MPSPEKALLNRVLSEPSVLAHLSMSEWDLLVRQARDSELLARLYYLCDSQGCLASIPRQVVEHLHSAARVTQRHAVLVRVEARRIEIALQALGSPVVLLKGAAYTLAQLPPAQGRLFTDIDILLPRKLLPKAELLLEQHGWLSTHHDDYEDRYYRRWMHELPPLKHAQRQTLLDVHHAILPLTARLKPSSDKLLSSSVKIDGFVGLYHLGYEDLVLHSATHLFHDGEFEHGLRDLVDIDGLLRQFSKRTEFWSDLLERAQDLGLERPLFYALEQSQTHLLTPIPPPVLEQARLQAKIPAVIAVIMRYLFFEGLRANHRSCRGAATGFAEWWLYVRAHYLRMPWYLLLPHLFYKGAVAPFREYWKTKKSPAGGGLDAFMTKKITENRSACKGDLKSG